MTAYPRNIASSAAKVALTIDNTYELALSEGVRSILSYVNDLIPLAEICEDSETGRRLRDVERILRGAGG